jgi:hypothetical protein
MLSRYDFGRTPLLSENILLYPNSILNNRGRIHIFNFVSRADWGWAGHVACTGKMRSACKIFVCQPEGKIPLRRSRCAWADSIRMDLKIGWKDVDWIHLAQYWDQWRVLVNTVINFRFP